MPPEIKSAIVQVLGGAIFGALIAYFAFALQRKRKVLEYIVFAMPLVRFTPEKQRNLSLAVDEFVLTGDEASKGTLVPVNNAFGFEIEILNMGNEEIVEPSIEVRLHDSAKIIEYETKPTSETAYRVSINRESSSPNLVRIVPQYLNKRERLLIRLISTDNANLECHVKIRGMGIISRPYGTVRKLVSLIVPLLAPILTVVLVSKLFPTFFPSLGVVQETVIRQEPEVNYHFPAWLLVALPVFVFGPAIIVFVNLFRHPMPTRTQSTDSSTEAHWDLDKAKGRK